VRNDARHFKTVGKALEKRERLGDNKNSNGDNSALWPKSAGWGMRRKGPENEGILGNSLDRQGGKPTFPNTGESKMALRERAQGKRITEKINGEKGIVGVKSLTTY